MCLQTKVLASLNVILIFFFSFPCFTFPKKNGSVGRWETKHFMGMALQELNIKISNRLSVKNVSFLN